MTVEQLISYLQKLPGQAEVFNAHLLKDGVTIAKLRVVATAEKGGEVLLCDRDVVLAIRSKGLN